MELMAETIELPDRRRLLTLQEAADLCRVDYDTVLKWVRAGALPFVEVGPTRIKRVYRRDVELMIQPGSACG